MNICKICKKEILLSNIDTKDFRFCSSCGKARRDYIRNRKTHLYQLQHIPLEAKIQKSLTLINAAINEFTENNVYLSYSGGKDSTVLSHLVKKNFPNILHVFCNTTTEYPETLEHVLWERDSNNTNVEIIYPKDRHNKIWTFKRVVDEYGYPLFSKRISNAIRTYRRAQTPHTKQNALDYIQRNFKKYEPYIDFNISDRCCDKLKKTPLIKYANNRSMTCSILGIRASESRQRELDWIDYGCNAFYTRKNNQCRPLAFWTNNDIDTYILQNELKISDTYRLGYSRNGCMFCGYGIMLESSPNRYQLLQQTHPSAYKFLVSNFSSLFDVCNIIY